jgi:glycosyltransferase involved in cell wall biosynthesis
MTAVSIEESGRRVQGGIPGGDCRPRVLLFTDSFIRGGTERQFVRLVRNLDRSRYDIRIACLQRRGPLLTEIETLGMPITEFPINSLYNLRTAKLFIRLVRFLRRERIHVLHAFDFYADVFAVPAARIAGVPVVLASRRELLDLRSLWQRRAVRFACRLATGVVVNSRAAGADLLNTDPSGEERVHVIPNCIDLQHFRPSMPRNEVRSILGFGADSPLIGTLCNLRAEKNVEMFLQAARQVQLTFPESRFVIVGDGPERERLQRLADELGLSGAVLFLGDRGDVSDLLGALDLFVLTSRTESFPNAILEAMSVGCPAVATLVGGVAELVREGENGFLVPPGESGTLAERIIELLRDPARRQAMGRAGRLRVKREFLAGQVSKRLQDLYSRMLHEGGSAPAVSTGS